MPPQAVPDPDLCSLPLDQSHILLTSFNSFLTVAIHNILYYRNIYPRTTFLSTRAYNLPVHQNRHPKVCAWIRDAVDAVAVQLPTGHVARIAIATRDGAPRELHRRWPDLDEQLRGALRRMASTAEGMAALPAGCTFTVAVELGEEGRAPIGV
ncbi:DNA-binding protein [Trichocladium antarcticum]|uniref:DNA-binding protein n=1 Tax=Trichocladium antarcticum TaxID=1450529 RepID=A0AAN6UKQ4_9PEZI|nr:DNA-binding protein [Trichocladium antarcticum]